MSVSVTRRQLPGCPQRVQLTFLDAPQPSPLTYDADLGCGVTARIDVLDPGHWVAIRVDRWDDDTRPLLDALIGADAVKQLERALADGTAAGSGAGPGRHDPAGGGTAGGGTAGGGTGGSTGAWTELDVRDSPWPEDDLPVPEGELAVISRRTAGVTVDLTAADPWLRVAFVDALDRWLDLPLDQRLVDAERAAARAVAARELPVGEGRTTARDRVLADGLRIARAAWGAIDGVLEMSGAGPGAGRVTGLGADAGAAVREALRRIGEGYRALNRALPEPDGVLDGVAGAAEEATGVPAARQAPDGAAQPGSAGAQIVGDVGTATDRTAGVPTVPQAVAAARRALGAVASAIDPRQLTARLIRVEPGAGEVLVTPSRLGDRPAAEVVAAAHPALDGDATVSDAAQRLLVRLLDRADGRLCGEALLTLEAGADSPEDAVFRGIVPLGEGAPELEGLRADVFDALVDRAPVLSDHDPDLQAAREAVRRLTGERVAGVHLTGAGAGQAGLLRRDAADADAVVAPLVAEVVAAARRAERLPVG